MKRIAPILFVMILTMFVLTACSPQGFVQFPEDVSKGITLIVTLAISWVFVRLITLIPALAFLDQFRTPLSLAVSAEVVVLLQNLIPNGYDDLAVTGFRFLLAIFAVVFGVLKYLQVKQVRGFK